MAKLKFISLFSNKKVRERLGLDITVKDLAPNGVVTLFSVAIEKLDESHAGEWSCLVSHAVLICLT